MIGRLLGSMLRQVEVAVHPERPSLPGAQARGRFDDPETLFEGDFESGRLGLAGLEGLCRAVRAFARTPFVTSLDVRGLAAMLSRLQEANGDEQRLGAVLAGCFPAGDPRATEALDELIGAMEDPGWELNLPYLFEGETDWRSARLVFLQILRRCRESRSHRSDSAVICLPSR